MRAPPTYTYYAGFEYEFKKITKKYGKKTYFEIEYADEISKYKKDNVHDSDSENNSDRVKIWTKSLSKFKIENKKSLLNELSRVEINGREIGNILDIIFTLLKSNYDLNDEIKYKDFNEIFRKCIDINNESDFSAKENSMYT